jgi:DNA mismatch endonuclease, patch repair protein
MNRSMNMRAIKSKNTSPEIKVRKLLFKMGYRFVLYKKELPGTPDITLPKYKTVIFVNGCFWHRHEGCKRCTLPKTNTEYWNNKFRRTVERDNENYNRLKSLGWEVIIIWECELKDMPFLEKKIREFLQ